MSVPRALARISVALLAALSVASFAMAQESTTAPGNFPEGHLSASARKLGSESTGPRQKYAIVIGNQTYAHAPALPNAWNDAVMVLATL